MARFNGQTRGAVSAVDVVVDRVIFQSSSGGVIRARYRICVDAVVLVMVAMMEQSETSLGVRRMRNKTRMEHCRACVDHVLQVFSSVLKLKTEN